MTLLFIPTILASLLSSTILQTHALPASQTSLLDNSSLPLPSDAVSLNTTTPNADYFVCYDGSMIRQSQRAPTPDCLKAVLHLSRKTDTAIFHQGGADDGYQLPVQRAHGSCSVNINIAQGFTEDKSSWVGISLLASQLTQACSTLNFPSGKTGGETFEGDAGKVRIKVGKVLRSNSAMNETSVENTGGSNNAMDETDVETASNDAMNETNLETAGYSNVAMDEMNLETAGGSNDTMDETNVETAGGSNVAMNETNLETAGDSNAAMDEMNLETAGSSNDTMNETNVETVGDTMANATEGMKSMQLTNGRTGDKGQVLSS